MAHEDRDLLPLGSTFDVARRGYDRRQVDEHLDRLDADLRILAADRDAAVARAAELGKQVENQRAQLISNERDMARLASAPATMEGMTERLQRMLRLAQDEASEIRARAETEASEMMARAEADGGALRDRYQRLIADIDDRRADMEDEHRSLMEKAQAEAGTIIAEATNLARQADAKAAARRQQVEEDFDIAMSARRADAMRVLAEQEATSRAQAHRRVAEATAEANRRLREATEFSTRMLAKAQADVDRLRTMRARIALQLRQVRSVLAEVTEAIEPLSDEHQADEHQADEHQADEHQADEHQADERQPGGSAAEGPNAVVGNSAWPADESTEESVAGTRRTAGPAEATRPMAVTGSRSAADVDADDDDPDDETTRAIPNSRTHPVAAHHR